MNDKLVDDVKLAKRGTDKNTYWVPRLSDLWEIANVYYTDRNTKLVRSVKKDHDNYVAIFNLVAKHFIPGFRGVLGDPYDAHGVSDDASMIETEKHEGFWFTSYPDDIIHTLMPNHQRLRTILNEPESWN